MVQNYSSGILLCDAGPGEIADFLHLGENLMLSLIHVKKASSDSPGRKVAASSYEVVVAQAVKNLPALATGGLAELLRRSPIAEPAVWVNGTRNDAVTGKARFLRRLAERDSTHNAEIVIVQPHVARGHVRAAGTAGVTSHLDAHRMRLLNTMLHSALRTTLDPNAQLYVVSST